MSEHDLFAKWHIWIMHNIDEWKMWNDFFLCFFCLLFHLYLTFLVVSTERCYDCELCAHANTESINSTVYGIRSNDASGHSIVVGDTVCRVCIERIDDMIDHALMRGPLINNNVWTTYICFFFLYLSLFLYLQINTRNWSFRKQFPNSNQLLS